jgi:hypothetical protein
MKIRWQQEKELSKYPSSEKPAKNLPLAFGRIETIIV